MTLDLVWTIFPDSTEDLCSWLASNAELLEQRVLEHGAVLLRGFRVPTREDFQRAVAQTLQPSAYLYRSTPRRDAGQNVYTATEYPPSRSIPLHCENAYQRRWPALLMFYCETEPREGGRTPLAAVAAVTDALDEDLKSRFVEHGVKYVRNYHPGLDLDWRDVFQTADRAGVEAYCHEHELTWCWNEDVLRTEQVCQAMQRHPVTGRELWFNQAHLFHASSLDARTRTALHRLFGADGLPRNTFYGDGTPISDATVQAIHEAFEQSAVSFEWQRGDMLLLDNMAMAHGRTPFCGERSVLVAMGNPLPRRWPILAAHLS